MTIKLQEAGITDVTILEKKEKVGGTWRENTYPGLSCDVPSHFYSYSFAPNPDWSRRYSAGPEIREYFEEVAARYDVPARIRFGCEVAACTFADGRWVLDLADGTRDTADFVIAAMKMNRDVPFGRRSAPRTWIRALSRNTTRKSFTTRPRNWTVSCSWPPCTCCCARNRQ